jgi:ATP-dependent helicase/nuclease subunit A
VNGAVGVGMTTDMIVEASAHQAFAADPLASAFVSANAGTGKTKLLTDRVLRLLLSGAPADGILCVTYTRTAAAEMRNRIFGRLAEWAIMPAGDLGESLAAMGMSMPSRAVRQRARSLFAEILDNDEGPRVETVHSFCQSILRRFPIEAGVAPHIALADDDEQQRLKAMARLNILNRPDPELEAAIVWIAETASEDQASDIVDLFINGTAGLESPDCLARVEAHFHDDLGLEDPPRNRQTLAAELARIDCEGLRAVAAALSASGVKQQVSRATKIEAWLAQSAGGRVDKWHCLCAALFSGGKARTKLSNAPIRKAFPEVDLIQQRVIAILEPLMAQQTAQQCRQRTLALYRYGMAFYREYSRLKAQRGLLDYNDLIRRTNRLLMASDAAHWVAWKLDNGIQHLLIDEAQDTSPDQWQLLRQLVDAFFDDAADRSGDLPARSVFAVGDFKQSIYSFQGADPLVMTENRNDLAARAGAARADFRNVSLSVSFRSTGPILDLVNAAIPSLAGIDDFSAHQLARAGEGGFVEVLPLVTGADDTDLAPEVIAARRLAAQIKSWIGTRLLPSGTPMAAGDILILMRKRRWFFELLLSALQAEGIMVAGADRMKLAEQIEIQDLLALGDVMHLTDDDLQLAAVLKSPLFGMDETELFNLAHDRGDASLFSRLMSHRGADTRFGAMADRLARWQIRAEYESVFGFFSFVLTDGGRQRFRQQLGSSVDESLDHFLALAQKFALGGGVSLMQFAAAIRTGGGEVKRDMDAVGSDEVRVMTVHGAKGLEAPVVILPDMLRPRRMAEKLVKSADGRFVYWLPPTDGVQPDFIQKAKDAASRVRAEEDNRLLYVALTRARDGLIVGGWEKGHGVRSLAGSDYEMLRTEIAAMPEAVQHDDGRVIVEAPQTARPKIKKERKPKLPPVTADDGKAPWLWQKAPVDDRKGRPLRPSQPGPDYTPSPLGDADAASKRQMALAYGRLAHRMLEILPALPAEARRRRAAGLAAAFPELSKAQAENLLEKVLALIESPEIAMLFGPDALVEVPINGRVHGYGAAGQIDRLYVDQDRIILADFKTGVRPAGPPPPQYCQQMALYDALLGQIYPGRDIECWLVWIEVSEIQQIDAAMRVAALTKIFASGPTAG